MNPTQQLSKEEFGKKYWFNSLQMITVINPLPTDWEFMVEMRHFIVRAGQQERFPGVIANVYLDQMTKILAQDDEKLEYMSDPSLKAIYYDKILVNVESLITETDTTPAYMRDVPATAIGSAPERAPWESNMERSSDIAPVTPPSVAPEPPKAPTIEPKEEKKAETKEFELDGSKYKMIVDKNDREMFYKNGVLTSAAEYAKAASML